MVNSNHQIQSSDRIILFKMASSSCCWPFSMKKSSREERHKEEPMQQKGLQGRTRGEWNEGSAKRGQLIERMDPSPPTKFEMSNAAGFHNDTITHKQLEWFDLTAHRPKLKEGVWVEWQIKIVSQPSSRPFCYLHSYIPNTQVAQY